MANGYTSNIIALLSASVAAAAAGVGVMIAETNQLSVWLFFLMAALFFSSAIGLFAHGMG